MSPEGATRARAWLEWRLHVVDVWESREVFDRFADDQIGPFSQQAGITEPPEMTFRDVHNHLPHS
jgi:hypothetical protein